MIVIADTSPLNYLVLIHEADLLQQPFGRVLIPSALRGPLDQTVSCLHVEPLQSTPDPELD